MKHQLVFLKTDLIHLEQRAEFFGKNPRVLRAFENLFQDVVVNIPDAVDNGSPSTTTVQPGTGINVTPNVDGVQLSVDLPTLVSAVSTFLPRYARTPPPAPDDANEVIAARVFARR